MKSATKKDFIKKLAEIALYRDHMRIFSDWLQIAALVQHQSAYHIGLLEKDEIYEEKEAAYMQAIKPYNREQLDGFCCLMAITQMALQNWDGDFLGSVFMELQSNSSQQAAGQFFTPFALSYMSAVMVLGDIAAHIAEKGYLTLSEPACGAGGMLIAAAKYCDQQNVDQRLLFFQAIDINRDCFYMTYLQTSFLQMSGYVIHGNTLSGEQWDVWATPSLQACQKLYPGFFGDAKNIVHQSDKRASSSFAEKRGQLALF